jgi:hypothetical protein
MGESLVRKRNAIAGAAGVHGGSRGKPARVFLFALLCALFLAPAPRAAHAADAPQSSPVESGQRALVRRTAFPWYDSQRDQLQRFDVEPPKDLQNRFSEWQTKPPPAWSVPSWIWTLLKVLGWILLGVVLVLLVVAFMRAYMLDASLPEPAVSSSPEPVASGSVDRIEKLPFVLNASQGDLLAEARRCYEAGDFGRAIVLLYSYELLQLDKYHWIRLAKGKTNRQYLREVRNQPPLRQFLETSMIAFEDVFFGRLELDRSRFEACWNGIADFQEAVGSPVQAEQLHRNGSQFTLAAAMGETNRGSEG